MKMESWLENDLFNHSDHNEIIFIRKRRITFDFSPKSPFSLLYYTIFENLFDGIVAYSKYSKK